MSRGSVSKLPVECVGFMATLGLELSGFRPSAGHRPRVALCQADGAGKLPLPIVCPRARRSLPLMAQSGRRRPGPPLGLIGRLNRLFRVASGHCALPRAASDVGHKRMLANDRETDITDNDE